MGLWLYIHTDPEDKPRAGLGLPTAKSWSWVEAYLCWSVRDWLEQVSESESLSVQVDKGFVLVLAKIKAIGAKYDTHKNDT